MSETRRMTERWWIDVCPECNGRVEQTVQTHNETCPNRFIGRVFPVRSVEVMPVGEHERWRDAFREGRRADHAAYERLRKAAQEAVETFLGWPEAHPAAMNDLRAVLDASTTREEER